MTAATAIKNPNSKFNEIRLWLAVVALLIGGIASVVNYYQGKAIAEAQSLQRYNAEVAVQTRIESDIRSCTVGNQRAQGIRNSDVRGAYDSIYQLAIFLGEEPTAANSFATVAAQSQQLVSDEEIQDRPCITVAGATPELVDRIYNEVNP